MSIVDTSQCVPYEETLWDKYDRLDNIVNPSSTTY